MNWFLVFIGGGMGSLIRYAISLIINKLGINFPIATLVSNVLACLLIGIFTQGILRGSLQEQHRLLFITGFCGGFSTFSTFSNETIQLWSNGHILYAIMNVILSISLCIIATFIGYKVNF